MNAWERFPIQYGEVWRAGVHTVRAGSILDEGLESYLSQRPIDMTYIDPPWNEGVLGGFYRRAGVERAVSLLELLSAMFDLVARMSPRVNYVEMGKQYMDHAVHMIGERNGRVTNIWPIVYHRKHQAYLIRYSFTGEQPSMLRVDGKDDLDTPAIAIGSEEVHAVADFCTGKGTTGIAAHTLSKVFTGTELDPKRAAHLLAYFDREGLYPRKVC